MKKILSFILSVLMLASCVAFTAFAKEIVIDEGYGFALAIDDVDAAIGDTVTVKITVKFADTGICGGEFRVKYPADRLTLVLEEPNEDEETPGSPCWLFGAAASNGTISTNTPGEVFGTYAAIKNSKKSGDFFEMKFVVNEGAYGKTDIVFDTVNFDTMGEDDESVGVFCQTYNGSVYVEGAPATPTYNVTFDANLEGVVSPEAKTDVEANTEIDLPVLDDLSDYTFRGWKVNGEGESLTGKYTVTADTAFVADWEKIAKYTVTFETAYGEAPAAVENVVTGTEIELEVLEDTADYKFAGWKEANSDTVYTGKYTVTKTVTLVAIWEQIVKYTVTFSEGADAVTVVAGESVTLPTLTGSELSFKGWKADGSDEILAGGAVYVPTASVLLTAVWGGGKVVYVSADGNDANGGLKADDPVLTIERAYEIVNDPENAIEEIYVTGTVTLTCESDSKAAFGIAGKTLTFKGDGTDSCIYVIGKAGLTDTAIDAGRVLFRGNVTLENITLNSTNVSEVPFAYGNVTSLTIKDGVKFYGRSSKKVDGVTVVGSKDYVRPLATADYVQPQASNLNLVLTLDDEELNVGTVYAGFGYGGNTRTGNVKVVLNKGSLANLYFSKGATGSGNSACQIFKGTGEYEINGGKVTNLMFGYGMSYHGLGYATINGGEVTKIYTTGLNSSFATWSTVVQQENSGVRVWEINGGKVDKIERLDITGDAYKGFEDAFTNVTRLVIFNNGTTATVSDTGAIVLNVKNGKISADVTVADGVATLNGLKYVLPEAELSAEGFNAVKVGEETYILADLEGGLIPAPVAAGAYDVEFVNVYKVTIGEDTYLVEEGDTIALTRLPQDGELKHIGWTTVENGDTAEINHTVDYAPTSDVTLYPVWAAAVYFTATFETAHGTAPEAISIIDDNEDGKADAEITLPGYEGKVDEHFTFVKWTVKDNAEVSYNAGETLVLEGNIVFVAEWEEDPKATVTYVDAYTTAPEAVTDYVGTEIEIAAAGAVEGFEFLGWTDGENVYQAGEKLTIATDVTLTAKWGVKVAVDANGAKGMLPVIGGTIGEEIDLPTEVALTKVNNTFVGFALSADGEVITGKYTVNPEDTLYVIWEETVSDAAIIETKVTYYTGTGAYLVDVYMYGKNANTVAFGYIYGENLEYVGFTPAEGLSLPDASLTNNGDAYCYAVVTDEADGKIEGAAATAGNGVHLGTFTFTYVGADKEAYEQVNAADNVGIAAPVEIIENVASEEYFLYVPSVANLSVTGLPVVFDEAVEVEIITVVYPVLGTFSVVRDSDAAPQNFATITAMNGDKVIKTFTVENAETEFNADGYVEYAIELPEGEYTLVLNKTGYLEATVDVVVEAQEGADEEGFEPEAINVEHIDLIAGEVVRDGVIDLYDFVGITSNFGRGELEPEQIAAIDINEDGLVTVDDLMFVKLNFGEPDIA